MFNTSSTAWFGVSLLLAGAVAGYGLGKTVNGSPVSAAPRAQVAQDPSPAPTPAPIPTPPPPPAAKDVSPVDVKTDHIRGNPKAKISIIEYSDFECPFCKRHHPTMQQVLEDYGDDVNWVYRHFPLSFHPNAEPAAIASECVNELGGNDTFWKFTDKIFETQGEWDYNTYVEELGIDVQKFQDCVDSGKYAQHLKDDMAGGSAAGVSGTPGNIVLNNETGESRLISGAQPAENFKSAIDALLDSKPQAQADDAPSGETRMVMMNVDNWSFSPSKIVAKKGEKVMLHLMGKSGVHGFSVPDLGIDERVEAGKMAMVMIPTDKVGTFDVRCSIMCGPGHSDMRAQIVIES